MVFNKTGFSALALSLISSTVCANNSTSFNPDISLILAGGYGSYSNTSDYALPGFMLGGEATRGKQGFYVGHNELAMSANVDDLFYGKFTTAIADHEGTTEVELEEAYIETMGLGNGFNVKFGRFFSGIGYLNSRHGHAWDFADAPLVYRGMFGDQIIDDGVQVSWVAPTDLYFKLGAEATRGEKFPGGGTNNSGIGVKTIFAKWGGDVGDSHSWQAGMSHRVADISSRKGFNATDNSSTEVPSYTGRNKVTGLDFIWKWSPHGNPHDRNLKVQAEYFERSENGNVSIKTTSPLQTSTYNGSQHGWYVQAAYQYMPRWRLGLRYDQLGSSNSGSNNTVLNKAGLISNGFSPKRTTLMLDYSRSEFSRIRFQIEKDDSYQKSDTLFFVQYIMSLGSHGAHTF